MQIALTIFQLCIDHTQQMVYNHVHKIGDQKGLCKQGVMMSELIRTQILLEKDQRKQLDEIAEKMGVSFSEIVRSFLNAQLVARTYQEMQLAAQNLADDYASDPELTAFTCLDGEDFVNA